jgi:hypothetical protein
MLYSILLPLHNILRWVLLATALFAIYRAFSGWLGKKEWTPTDHKAGMWYTMAFDIQLLVGLILYFFASPLVQTALKNFAGAMKNNDLRFFSVEHIALMIFALGLSHGGRTLSRKATSAAAKHRAAAILFTLALLVVLAAIPWARPLIRF